MAQATVTGATLECSFGAAPSVLTAIPKGPPVTVEGKPAATILDFAPAANLPPFGTCSSLANPTVASATAAAQGVLTPMPCVPVTAAPWAAGSPTVLIHNAPALNNASTCTCAWGGVIQIAAPGQLTTQVP